jgi:hypothetical protein
MTEQETLIYELYNNKYVEQGEAHRIWDLFHRAAKEIESLENCIRAMDDIIQSLEAKVKDA